MVELQALNPRISGQDTPSTIAPVTTLQCLHLPIQSEDKECRNIEALDVQSTLKFDAICSIKYYILHVLLNLSASKPHRENSHAIDPERIPPRQPASIKETHDSHVGSGIMTAILWWVQKLTSKYN